MSFGYGDSRNEDVQTRGSMGLGLMGAHLGEVLPDREPGYLMVDFDDRAEEHQQYLTEFFQKEPCLYTHRVFKFAAMVFKAVKHQRLHALNNKGKGKKEPGLEFPNIEFDDSNEKRLTFGLVFSTLKYQQFLEDMLEDCQFFVQYPEYQEHEAVVMVILCDFKLRKFQMRTPQPGEVLDPELSEIEQMLYGCKTKLDAALARSRIKACVISIDHLLPESVRKNDKLGANMCVHCWVNYIKTGMQSVQEMLEMQDFVQVEREDQLSGKTFFQDPHCSDLLAFPADQRDFLEQSELVQKGELVVQDKSSCVGPQSVRNLINEGDDIMHVNMGSGLATAHLASLTHGSDTVIYAFGCTTERQKKHVEQKLDRLGAKSRVRIMMDNFLEIEHHDERLKHIKVALVMADCSKSAVANPVNFIVSEGEEMNILKDLSIGQLNDAKVSDLATSHCAVLKLSMRLPRVQAVVYCTRSLIEAENEGVVTRVIEFINMMYQKKTPFRVAPPVVPMTEEDIRNENPLIGKYLRYLPSAVMSGCFIATITREVDDSQDDIPEEKRNDNALNKYSGDHFPEKQSGDHLPADDPKEAAKDILARAAARGIITGVPTKNDKKKKKGTKKKDKAKKEKEKKEGAAAPTAAGGAPEKVKSAKPKKGKVSSTPAFFTPYTNHNYRMRMTTQSAPTAASSQSKGVAFSNSVVTSQQSLATATSSQVTTVTPQTVSMQLIASPSGGRPSPQIANRLKAMSSSSPSVGAAQQYVMVPEHRKVVKHPGPFR